MKYDIHKNPPPLKSENILKHKNFDALFAQFESNPTNTAEIPNNNNPITTQTPFPRWIGWSAGLAAASVALVLLFQNINSNSENINHLVAHYPQPITLISPVPNLNKPFISFSVSNNDTLLTANSGSTIKIPAAAFVDKSGKPIQGKVDIQYREMHDHVDMFLAGLPQTEKHNQKITATAVQIQGYQNGEPVYINNDKNLEIALHTTLPASVPIQQLQVFAYDATADDWTYKTTDKVEVISNNIKPNSNNLDSVAAPNININKTETQVLAELQKRYPKPTIPTKHSHKSEDREVFDIDFNPAEFPEFANLQNLRWVAVDKDIPYRKSDASRNWFEMAIVKNNEGEYQLFLQDSIGKLNFKVSPLTNNADEAEKLYQNQLADYQKQLVKQTNVINNEIQNWRKLQNINTTTNPNKIAVIHRFAAAQFGVWACTYPQSKIYMQSIQLASYDNLKQIYIAEPNSCFYRSTNVTNTIAVPENAMIWAVDNQQKISVGQQINNNIVFNEINPNSEQQFRMILKSKELYN
jgi:hypothetical protein